jgi:hypothetical protein
MNRNSHDLKNSILTFTEETLVQSGLYRRYYDSFVRFKLRLLGQNLLGENKKMYEENKNALTELAKIVGQFKFLRLDEKYKIARILHYKNRYFISIYFHLIETFLNVKKSIMHVVRYDLFKQRKHLNRGY